LLLSNHQSSCHYYLFFILKAKKDKNVRNNPKTGYNINHGRLVSKLTKIVEILLKLTMDV
jgi:hypothetical protein